MDEYIKERSVGELFSKLTLGLSRMLRQEIALAKAEMSQKVSQGVKDVAFLIVGGFVVYGGFLALIAAAIAGLDYVVPLWLAALIVGVIVVGIGYAFVQKGISDLKHRSLKPEQTIETVKEGTEWAKQQI
jgi:hypothetical protein